MSYSKLVQAAFAKLKIEPGDRLCVKSPKGNFEGVLLPRPDASGGLETENVLILKLDNGYNVGVSFDGARIEKQEGKTALEQFASWTPPLTGKNKLSLVATGGTIGTRVDYKTGGVYMLLEPDQILARVPEIASLATFSLKSPFRKASEDMDYKDWQTLAKEVAAELNSDSQGVIVTHGTDILHYTAAALSFMLPNLNKPVAVVGAQRSPDRGSFDGGQNLLSAAHYCMSDAAEVSVVMHGTSSDDYCLANIGTKVRKMHTSRRDAFRPINCQPLAKIWPDGKKEFLWKDYRRRADDREVVPDTKFEPKVAAIKPFPGQTGELIDFYVDKKYKGILIEAWALGHVPTSAKHSWIPSIERAVEEGVFVAVASQALYGRVHPAVYANLRKVSSLGVLYCEDMLPETAFVKLGWVLGRTRDAKEVKNRMLTNVAHEISPRHQQEDFLA